MFCSLKKEMFLEYFNQFNASTSCVTLILLYIKYNLSMLRPIPKSKISNLESSLLTSLFVRVSKSWHRLLSQNLVPLDNFWNLQLTLEFLVKVQELPVLCTLLSPVYVYLFESIFLPVHLFAPVPLIILTSIHYTLFNINFMARFHEDHV